MRGVRSGAEKIECARNGCKKKFQKRVHNQKFCCTECCQKATNEKLLNKYYERKKPLAKNRKCKTRGCQTILSQYNRESFCGPCEQSRMKKLLTKR